MHENMNSISKERIELKKMIPLCQDFAILNVDFVHKVKKQNL